MIGALICRRAVRRRAATAFSFLTAWATIALAQSPPSATAQPALLHELFQDHGVLQRDRPIEIWGRAAKGETVTASLGGAASQGQADSTGRWRVQLPAMAAGGPYELTVQTRSGAQQVAHDILVGDVFLCSGQSNMELDVQRAGDSWGEISNSRHSTIRLLNVTHDGNPAALTDFSHPVSWQVAGPDTVGSWSAVCYFFARELQKTTRAPIGLVHSSWSGANIRPWLSAESLRAAGGYTEALDLLTLYAKDQRAAQVRFAAQWEAWWRAKTGDRPGTEPWNAKVRASSASSASIASAAGEWHTAPAGLGNWRKWGIPQLEIPHGVLWYRTTLTLSAAQARSPATLALGTINQVDQTWINGRPVGNTFGYNTERIYSLPSGLLHAGENTLVVNVMSTWDGGGLIDASAKGALHLSSGESIPLPGEWQYRMVPASTGYPPRAPWDPVGGVATLYNAMIAPLGSYGLKGMLWYQGESNTEEPESYQGLLRTLMADRRREFGADLPALIVQLPNFGPLVTAPTESGWSDVREAQRLAVANDAHAGLAVTIDIGEPHNLHPTDKQDVGIRLARAARKVIYGEPITPSGPVPGSVTRSANQLVIRFHDIDAGLVAYSHERPIGFELCGEGPHTCQFADARIDGTAVSLSIPPGVAPKRVRYCWGDSPVCTLFDRDGLPAGPFELPVGDTAAAELARLSYLRKPLHQG